MKILLDEDTPIQLLEILRRILVRYAVDHVTTVRWSGKSDINLYRDAGRGGYDVVVTNDTNQLNDPDEVRAIRRSGIHHVRYTQRNKGPDGLALAIGAVVAAMPAVAKALEDTQGQRLVRIHGLDPVRRFDLVNPKTHPPAYWR